MNMSILKKGMADAPVRGATVSAGRYHHARRGATHRQRPATRRRSACIASAKRLEAPAPART